MPADTTRTTSQRGPRKVVLSEEDLTIRRARGEISCAECRRLKLKCDKRLPCSSCDRRGCPNICPNGTLSAGQGSRFILADTTELHHKITEMSQRIRQLEDAVAVFHANLSDKRHPLLSDELLSIKFWPSRPTTTEEGHSNRDTVVETLNAFGSLTVGDRGEAKYFGSSAGSEALLAASDVWDGSSQQGDNTQSSMNEGPRFPTSLHFDLHGMTNYEVHDLVWTELPPQTRAWSLCEAYFEHASWFFTSVPRDEVINGIMTPTYKLFQEKGKPDYNYQDNTEACPHKLAVLYMVFALGAMMDLTLPPNNPEAAKYFYLARGSLTLRSMIDSPSIETVQALSLMGAYRAIDGRRNTMDSAWSLSAISCKMAQSLGLHRDCARWGLDAKEVQRRRFVFWSIFTCDVVFSISCGRPLTTPLAYVDCEFPTDEEQTINENGEVEPGYRAWRFHIMKDMLAPICERMLVADPPTYDTLLELDANVRQMPVPKSFKLFMDSHDDDRPSACIKAYLPSQYRMNAMLVIHRSYFAQALLDHPLNPFRSPYAPSYLAAYRCASVAIKSCIYFFERSPNLIRRFASFWTHAFSASLIVGFVVTRTPNSSLASSALVELNQAVGLFEKAHTDNFRAWRALTVLRKMRERANRVYSQYHNQESQSIVGPDPSTELGDGRDELAIFGGKTLASPPKIFPQDWSQSWRSKPMVSRPNRAYSMSPLSWPSDARMAAPAALDVFPPESANMPDSTSERPPSMQWLDLALESMLQPNDHVTPPTPTIVTPSTMPTQSEPLSYPGADGDNMQAFSDLSAFSAYYDPTTTSDLSDWGLGPDGSGVDSQWMSLLRESGILDPVYNGMIIDGQPQPEPAEWL